MRNTIVRVASVSLALLLGVSLIGQAATPSGKQHHSALKELHEAKILLETAKHDYDGKRASAVHEISEAIHDLVPHHTGHHSNSPTPTTTPGESQKTSDHHLREAEKLLTEAEHKLSGHPKAEGHIHQALKHLREALEIK